MASRALARLDRLTRYEALIKLSEEIVVEHNLNSLFERLAGLLERVLDFDLVIFSVNDPDRQSIAVHVVEKGRLVSPAVPLDFEYQQWISIPRIANKRNLPSGL